MLWRLRALYMMTRGYAPINVFLAFVLLCLFPAELQARTRTHPVRAKQHLPMRGHASALPRGTRRLAARAGTRHPAHGVRVSAVRFKPSRAAAHLALPHRASIVIQPHRITALVARSAPDAGESGVAHPPDALEIVDVGALPPSIPVPVISVIRQTGERPQLPSIEEAAATPAILPSLYDKRGRLVVPPAMKGSREILLHQNEVADRDGLARVQDDSDLEWMRRRAMLVSLPASGAMQVDARLPVNRRYCRPWTAQFLANIAKAHYAQFHTPLQVNSAVRTVVFQQRLLHTNGNAAPAGGETASPHLTGQAIDLAKRGLSLSEIAWLRGYLLPLVQQGQIDVEEEFQQACFHISVYKSYLPSDSLPRREIAVTHRDRPAALAIALQ